MLYNESNLKTLERLKDETIQLTLTSPPYGNARDYEGFEWELVPLVEGLYRTTKQGGVVVWVVNDQTIKGSESGESFRQALQFKESGWFLHDTMIWEKPNFSMPSRNRYHQIFEYMFVFSKGAPGVFNPIIDRPNKYAGQTALAKNTIRSKDGTMIKLPKKVYRETGMRNNIWRMNTSGQERPCRAIEHPATFPEKLAHDHIISWLNPGDVIYDPFMGSGTVAKIAIELDRNWIGSEISSEYCDIIHRRIKNA